MGLNAKPNYDKKFYSIMKKLEHRLEKEKEASKIFKSSKKQDNEDLTI